MKKLNFDYGQITDTIHRIVERTFEMDLGWDWPAGVAFYGVGQAYQATKNPLYLKWLQQWVDEYIDFGLPPISVNSSSMGHTLLTLYQETEIESYLELAKKKADFLVHEAPKFDEGILEHTVAAKSFFPQQAWIDTVFMSGLFLVRMAHATGNPDYLKVGLDQFRGHEKYLQDPVSHLFYHGWDHAAGNNMSAVHWARGNAWAAYSTAVALRLVDVKNPEFMEMNGSVRDQLGTLMKLQSENGLWHTILTDPASYEETSASAGIGAALVARGIGTPKSQKAAQKVLDGLLTKVAPDGTVMDVSTGTAVMNTPEGYRTTSKKRIEGWGQGLALAFSPMFCLRASKPGSISSVIQRSNPVSMTALAGEHTCKNTSNLELWFAIMPSGRSTKSFIDEGRFDRVLDLLAPGDYVLIQFGHNDQKLEDPSRGTGPYEDYQKNLRYFIEAIREKRALPILVDSVSRRVFDENGEIAATLSPYPEAMAQVAQDSGVPLIGLNQKSADFYKALGPEASQNLFAWYHRPDREGAPDNTHFDYEGARQIAKLVAEGIREQGLPLLKEV